MFQPATATSAWCTTEAACCCRLSRSACGTTSAAVARSTTSARSFVAPSDLGITQFDLANNYGPPYGSAEENFGRLMRDDLAPHRDELVISTKAGYPGSTTDAGLRRARGCPRPLAGPQNDNGAQVDSAFEDRDVPQCAPSTKLGEVVAKVRAQAWARS